MASTPQPNGASLVANPSPAPQRATTVGPPNAQGASNGSSTQPANGTGTATSTDQAPIPAPPLPHDARTIQLILASLGVTAYQERVPLQLLDFAYRYTAGILGDAAHLAAEGYTVSDSTNANGTGSGKAKSKQTNEGDVTLPALRLATSSRLGYQFSASLPKQTLLEIAEERNRIRLPDVSKTKVFGVRLPEERFLVANRTWGLLEDDTDDAKSERSTGTSHTMTKEEMEGGSVNGTKDETMEDAMEDEDEKEDGEDGDGYQSIFGKPENEDDAMEEE